MKTFSAPPSHTASRPPSQRGVSLVVVLLFIVTITGLSVWAARQSMLGEGMARNQVDQEVALQAAESALRDAERDLKSIRVASTLANASCNRGTAIIPVKFKDTCPQGLCLRNDTYYAAAQWITSSSNDNAVNPEPWWPPGKNGLWNNDDDDKPGRTPVSTTNCSSFTGGVPLGTYTGAPAIRGVAKQPEYLIEYFQRSVTGRQEMAVYRITARGFGYTTRTQVVLQTTFLPE